MYLECYEEQTKVCTHVATVVVGRHLLVHCRRILSQLKAQQPMLCLEVPKHGDKNK
jgi:hypothetical protein